MTSLEDAKLDLGWGTVLIDAADRDVVGTHRWHRHTDGKRCYAMTSIKGKSVYMHRLIMNAPFSMGGRIVVDHVNGDGLDNRRHNLRVCSQSENLANAKRSRGRSKFKGVFEGSPGRWLAYMRINYKKHHLGYYASEIEAAIAYNRAVMQARGEFASINPVADDGRELRRLAKPKKSQHKNVTAARGRWRAAVYRNGKQHYSRSFATEEEAAAARDALIAGLKMGAAA